MFKRLAAYFRRRSWDEHFKWVRDLKAKQQRHRLEITFKEAEERKKMSRAEWKPSDGHKAATRILEALEIPPEANVTWLEFRLDWSNDPIMMIQYEHLTEPIILSKVNEIVKVLRSCKFVGMYEEEERIQKPTPPPVDVIYEGEREPRKERV